MSFGALIENSANIIRGEKVSVTSIVRDSRSVEKGSCFVACNGLNYDGYKFIDDAISNGAVAIVSDRKCNLNEDIAYAMTDDSMKTWGEMSSRWFGDSSSKLNVVGVTGTNGKTTITYILESIFKSSNLIPGVIGTVEYRYPEFKCEAKRTTPDAYELQSLFSRMSESGVNTVAMEVSSHAIDQKRIAGTKFKGAIFTNLTPEHLDYHSNMEHYYESKARLFKEDLICLEDSFASINIDDFYGTKLISEIENMNIWSYGFTENARVKGENLILSNKGLEFDIKYDNSCIKIISSLYGKFNAYNILAAVSASLAMNLPVESIKKGIENLKTIPGRAEYIKNDQDIFAIVDYAHTPDAIENILKQTRTLTKGRLIVTFGCGGDRDKEKRKTMGEIAATYADYVIVTDDNPRTEDPKYIREQIFSGVSLVDDKKGKIIGNRKEAIEYALKIAVDGDAVVVAGKGHENYQEINGERTHFDDREIVAEILK